MVSFSCMRYLRALGVLLGIVLLGIFVSHRVDRSRSLAMTGPPKLAAKAQQAAERAEAGLRAGVAEKPVATEERVIVAKSPGWSAPRATLSALKLIRSAEVSIELKSYADGARAAEAIARACEGYVAESKSTSASAGIRSVSSRRSGRSRRSRSARRT